MIYTLVIILTILAAVLLIGIVLIQKSKGGGLGSTFASSNSILGVKRTNDVVEKATWWLAGIVCVLSIFSVFCAPALTTDKSGAAALATKIDTTPAVPGVGAQDNLNVPGAANDAAAAAVVVDPDAAPAPVAGE